MWPNKGTTWLSRSMAITAVMTMVLITFAPPVNVRANRSFYTQN